MGEVCWCVVCWQAVVFCAPGRVAGRVCLGVFPTWCIKAGADTGSMKTFFPLCVTLLVVMRSSGGVVTTHFHCHFSLCLSWALYCIGYIGLLTLYDL